MNATKSKNDDTIWIDTEVKEFWKEDFREICGNDNDAHNSGTEMNVGVQEEIFNICHIF